MHLNTVSVISNLHFILLFYFIAVMEGYLAAMLMSHELLKLVW